MAKKYSKYTSNFILSQPIQNTEKGTINLRDWTTIGEINRLDKGKIPIYGNGEFKFTVRNVTSNPTKHIVSKFIGTYDYDDVKNASSKNNLTELNLYTNDLRDFAYYGSATELVRATIQQIIKTFPARITLSDEKLNNRKYYIYNNEIKTPYEVVELESNGVDIFNEDLKVDEKDIFLNENEYSTIYLINNPFEIDLHHENLILDENTNKYRFLTYSFKDFQISDNGIDYEDIIRYEVILDYEKINQDFDYNINRFNCVFDGCEVGRINITTENRFYQLKGYLFGNKIKWGYISTVKVDDRVETKETMLFIQPKEFVLEEYFYNLKGLERILLNNNTTPLYSCVINTPFIENEELIEINRNYVFPNNNGFIDISSPLFTVYLNELYNIASIWDDIYTDNLYQRMTHESIKNYDWSYKRVNDENESEEIVIGGLRIEKLLHIYGRLFDDIKLYIDNIKNAHIITYDGYNNIPNALLTDDLESKGWYIVNTIPVLNINENGNLISKEFGNEFITNKLLDKENINEIKWFESRNKSKFNCVENNLNFFKKLSINSNYIFRSKGTKKSIEMIMGMFGFGDNDFVIEEVYYQTVPILYNDDIDKTFDKLVSSFEGMITEDNPYGALPVKVKKFDVGVNYIIPFLNPKINLNNVLYFQSKGGWCKIGDNYNETISYLRVKYNVSELLTLPPNAVKEGDVFYVVDLSDYVELYNTTTIPYTHYFVVKDVNNIHNPSGWINVDPSNDDHKNYNDYINYMESIVVTNKGNNPHVGFGQYDSGEYYKEYMTNPFKYATDKFTSTYDEYSPYKTQKDQKQDIDKFNFKIEEVSSSTQSKIFLFSDKQPKYYYLNSKILKINNNMKTNKYFSEYFKEVILPYIMQVIPSTTILLLNNF